MRSLRLDEIEADRARLGTFGPDAVPGCLLGLLRRKVLSATLARSCSKKRDPGKLSPAVRCAHVDHPHRRNAGARWLDEKQARHLATLDAAPELAFCRDQEVLIER